MRQFQIYTDGACDPNPGIGGWAAILIDLEHRTEIELTGGDADSTNNRMELTAVIEALAYLTEPAVVMLITDSEYVKNAFTQGWLKSWQAKGWKTAARQPVKNQDLWQKLLVLAAKHQIEWKWVRGHHVDPLNNRCDELAVAARRKIAAERRAARV